MLSIEIAEQAGDTVTEDVVVRLPSGVAVFDGATSVRPRRLTGGWYARELGGALEERWDSESALDDLLAGAIADVAAAHDLVPGDSPSSTASLVRWRSDVVEALVLADSPVVAFTSSGAEPLTDDRLANLRTPGGGGYRERLSSGGGFGGEHWDALRDSVDRTSRWRNVDGGFWVAEADPQAAHRAARASWSVADVRALLVATDGVSCGVDDYGLYPGWDVVLAEVEQSGARSVLDRVRAAEAADSDGTRWPRPKLHDDQALVVIHF